jgi:serine/threonine protein kinase
VLYEMLTCRRPFAAETDLATAMMRLTRDPVPVRALRPGIPRALEAVVQRAIARKPEDRFQTAENMTAALVRVRGPATGPAPALVPPPTARPLPNARRGGAFRSWMLVPLLAVIVAAIAIAVGLILGKLQLGGPLGIQAKQATPTPTVPSRSAVAIAPVSITAFDPPPGDGHEHDELIPNLQDSNPNTVWYTENYKDLNLAPKPGVGLLFDLGGPHSVNGFLLQTPSPGFTFQVKVGDDPAALENAPATTYTATGSMRGTLTQAPTGRYVLLWITSVIPGVQGGNRAAVGTFEVFGSRG